MNRDAEPRNHKTSEAEKTSAEHTKSVEHQTRPTIATPEPPRLIKAEIHVKNAATHARHMAEAELKVQAWFDAGMKPAEREEGLQRLIKDLEREFEDMEPKKDESTAAFNKRTAETLDELNAANAELTVLQRRLKETIPDLTDKDIAPLDEPENDFVTYDADQDELDLVNKPREGQSAETTFHVAHKPPKATRPPARTSTGLHPEIASPIRHPSSPERLTPESYHLGNFFADTARSAWGAIKGFFGGTKAPGTQEGFNQQVYNERSANYRGRKTAREAREASLGEKASKEVKLRYEAIADLDAQVEAYLLKDERAQQIKKFLKEQKMSPELRKSYKQKLEARREAIRRQLDEEEGEKIVAK